MSPAREPSSDEDLRDRLDRTFIQLRRQHEQLELALEPWRALGDQSGFSAAYESDDAAERNRAELVHANCERCHQLIRDVIELGAKLAERSERVPPVAPGQDRVDLLIQAGVITAGDEALLRVQTIVRNESQHAYVETVASQIYAAATLQLTDGRKLVGRLARWTEQLTGSG